MSIVGTLFSGENREIITNLQNETNLSFDQIEGVINNLFPKVTQAIQGSMADANLMNQMIQALLSVDLSSLASNSKALVGPETQEVGNKLLVGIFGSEESVHAVIQNLAATHNIDISSLSKVVPALTTSLVALVMQNSGGLSSLMTSFFQSDDSSSSLAQMANSLLGGDAASMMSKLLSSK